MRGSMQVAALRHSRNGLTGRICSAPAPHSLEYVGALKLVETGFGDRKQGAVTVSRSSKLTGVVASIEEP
jgi:hypothetical protein